MTPQGPFARYLDHVDERGCWVTWLAPNSSGYGTVWIGTKANSRRKFGLHVASYMHFVGDVPAGLVLDHEVCSNRLCFNYAHLRAVTQLRNVRRAFENLAKMPFPCGHPRVLDNTIRNGKNSVGNPSFRCRQCNTLRVINRRAQYDAVMGGAS